MHQPAWDTKQPNTVPDRPLMHFMQTSIVKCPPSSHPYTYRCFSFCRMSLFFWENVRDSVVKAVFVIMCGYICVRVCAYICGKPSITPNQQHIPPKLRPVGNNNTTLDKSPCYIYIQTMSTSLQQQFKRVYFWSIMFYLMNNNAKSALRNVT